MQLDHITPYLPYSPQVEILQGSILEGVTVKLTPFNISEYAKKGYDIKPYLRPLSDLTKEIEHEGRKFIPVQELECLNYLHGSKSLIGLVRDGLVHSLVEAVPYDTFCKLLEWHFDVFELIKNHKAIDINTLNNGK